MILSTICNTPRQGTAAVTVNDGLSWTGGWPNFSCCGTEPTTNDIGLMHKLVNGATFRIYFSSSYDNYPEIWKSKYVVPKNYRWFDVFRTPVQPKQIKPWLMVNNKIFKTQERRPVSQYRFNKRRLTLHKLRKNNDKVH